MKILLAHNFYQSSSPSGEDIVYRAEVDLLRHKGIDVVTYERSNDELSECSRRKTAVSAVWSRTAYDEVTDLIKKEKPEIAHFHNIWYLISPSAYLACRTAGLPIVQTLHNFRMFCANGLLLRNGKVCEECVGKLPWRGVVYGCFRNSRLYSVPVVASEVMQKLKRIWTGTVDAYISMTKFGRQKFIQCGLPDDRVYVKPNFLADPPAPNYAAGEYALYLGRLSEEKGVEVLLDAAKHSNGPSAEVKIKIVGDGPLMERLRRRCLDEGMSHVEILGRKSHSECMDLLMHARFLVLPSICYENFPLAIREAYACGKPVIASRLGAMAEIVQDKHTGLLFNPGDGDDLAEKMRWMTENEEACIEMGKNARGEFESKYATERNFAILMEIYHKVLSK